MADSPRMVPSDLVLSWWADDLFLFGHQAARWITDYVDLEESMAMGSIAQEALAHAATIWKHLGKSDTQRDWLIYQRPVEHWNNASISVWSRNRDDFLWTVCRGYLGTSAFSAVLDALVDSGDPGFEQTRVVMEAEQHLHVAHFERWMSLMAEDPAARTSLEATLSALMPQAFELFGIPAHADLATSNRSSLDLWEISEAWAETISSDLAGQSVDLPAISPKPQIRSNDLAGLAAILESVRSVRSAEGDRYLVYGNG